VLTHGEAHASHRAEESLLPRKHQRARIHHRHTEHDLQVDLGDGKLESLRARTPSGACLWGDVGPHFLDHGCTHEAKRRHADDIVEKGQELAELSHLCAMGVLRPRGCLGVGEVGGLMTLQSPGLMSGAVMDSPQESFVCDSGSRHHARHQLQLLLGHTDRVPTRWPLGCTWDAKRDAWIRAMREAEEESGQPAGRSRGAS
jgi:hypothetical protein